MPSAIVEENSVDEKISSGQAARSKQLEACLLTGGDDRPYAIGMALALAEQEIDVDFIGSDKLDAQELRGSPRINFLNIRGNQDEEASFGEKTVRILAYYARLGSYVVRAKPRVFHILWNNRFEFFDRTFLMVFYGLLGKQIVLTAHNVNTRKRDQCDTWLNRFSLRIQYGLSARILVHTDAMKNELASDFGISREKVTVIPFGINNTTPITGVDPVEARNRIGVKAAARTLLFFGQIAPYKGLEHLIAAMNELAAEDENIRLVIAGRVKPGHTAYWNGIEEAIARFGIGEQIIRRVQFIPDKEVEWYFQAADAVVTPYVQIFQSGVPFLSYSFGLPVIATDVGSLREDVVEGQTGFLCRPKDPADLARAIRDYFASDLYKNLEMRRDGIRAHANDRNSWTKVGAITKGIYEDLAAV